VIDATAALGSDLGPLLVLDALARSLGTAGSRRGALGGLLAGTLGILGWHDGDETAAHNLKAKCKKKCLKKAKKHAAQHAAETLPSGPTCTPTTCASQGKNCGMISDGCGQQIRCGPDFCDNGFHCTENGCRCLYGAPVCEGICCGAGEVCKDGTGVCCVPERDGRACAGKSCSATAVNTCGQTVQCCGASDPALVCGTLLSGASACCYPVGTRAGCTSTNYETVCCATMTSNGPIRELSAGCDGATGTCTTG
jgi:hypothetical protein